MHNTLGHKQPLHSQTTLTDEQYCDVTETQTSTAVKYKHTAAVNQMNPA